MFLEVLIIFIEGFFFLLQLLMNFTCNSLYNSCWNVKKRGLGIYSK